MLNGKWKEALGVLGHLAPTIATALGGPLAGMGTKVLTDMLMPDEDVKGMKARDVKKKLAVAILGGDTEGLARLRQADNDFQLKLDENNIKIEEIHAGDRDSARKREMVVKDSMPAILAIILTVLFGGALIALFVCPIPKGNETQINIMLGSLGTAWIGAMVYYFGSSRGSKRKTEAMASMIEGK